MMNRSLDIFGV